MHALRLEHLELPKSCGKLSICTIHFKYVIGELYVKEKGQEQKAITAQLLRFLGTIDLQNINDLNKRLHIETASCVCSNCKELMNFTHLVVLTATAHL